MKKYLLYASILLLSISFSSCVNKRKHYLCQEVVEWKGKKILFPKYSFFTIYAKDTVDVSLKDKTLKIISYIDSTGCLNCKLGLDRWLQLMYDLDSIHIPIPVLFYFHPRDLNNLIFILRKHNFKYPVCIDIKDSFNILNKFPNDMAFQTFLLDNNNRVLAIGNPIHNPKVKDLYLKIIRGDALGKNTEKEVVTTVSLDKLTFSMGTFSWEKEQNTTFLLKNIGDKAFVINDVTTSCGCTSVEYAKEPIRPGKSLTLHVTYKADHPGHFDKTISVYCNVPSSPIQLRIDGNAN